MRGKGMLALGSYEKTLRAVGQDLERRRIKNFELKNHQALILAYDKSLEQTVESRFPSKREDMSARKPLWKRILGREPKDAAAGEQGPKVLIYLKFDVEQLELEGKARATAPDLRPAPGFLPEALRLIGAQMDRERASLISISKTGRAFSARYATEGGKIREEEYGLELLHKFSLYRYKERCDCCSAAYLKRLLEKLDATPPVEESIGFKITS